MINDLNPSDIRDVLCHLPVPFLLSLPWGKPGVVPLLSVQIFTFSRVLIQICDPLFSCTNVLIPSQTLYHLSSQHDVGLFPRRLLLLASARIFQKNNAFILFSYGGFLILQQHGPLTYYLNAAYIYCRLSLQIGLTRL